MSPVPVPGGSSLRKTDLAGRRIQLSRWLIGAVVLDTALALFDGFDQHIALIGFMVAAPLITAAGARFWGTVAVGTYSVLLALGLGLPNDDFGDTNHLTRVLAVAVGGALATWVASLRAERERMLRRSTAATEHFKNAFDDAPTGMVLTSPDGSFRQVNRVFCAIAGWPEKELLGSDFRSLLHPDDLPAQVATFESFLKGERTRDETECRLRRCDGEWMWIRATSTLLRDAGGEPTFILSHVQDVEARRHAELQLRESEERFRMLVDGVDDYAIFMLDPAGRVVSWNAGAERLHGYRADEILGKDFSCFHTREDVERGKHQLELSTAMSQGRFEEEAWRVHKDGSRFWAVATVTAIRGDAGELRGFAEVHRDITERKRFEEELAHQALHDPLTGLPNRTLFLDRVDHALKRSRRMGNKVALLFIDLDRFKVINDSLGHGAGDEVLIALSARLRELVRPGDTIARFGGDEFTILCEDVEHQDDAVAVAERMKAAVEAPFSAAEREVFVTATTGIVVGDGRTETPEILLRDADAAMYRAKQGRTGHAVFDEGMRARAIENLETEIELRRALENDELRVSYQPQVDLRTGGLVGVEALVRWDHPTRGQLAPMEFVPLAEETGLIAAMGEFVLDEACRQVQQWNSARPDDRPLTMSVNLSAYELARPELPERVGEVLARTGIDPATLCLEITESSLMSTLGPATTLLLALHGMGVRLAVDDFGTGYSSLGYLQRFPIDLLKIDRAFVEGLGRKAGDSALVAAIIGMGHALGLTVVAEGAETEDQLVELRDLGCDVAQGHFFATPRPPEELEPMRDRTWRFRPSSRQSLAESPPGALSA